MPVAAMPENLGPRLTLDELRATVDEIRRVRSDQYADYTGRALALSGAVTRHFLGREWTQKHADPTSRHAGFFKIDTSPTIQGQLSAFRIYDLGEVLFNLQHIDGFDEPRRPHYPARGAAPKSLPRQPKAAGKPERTRWGIMKPGARYRL